MLRIDNELSVIDDYICEAIGLIEKGGTRAFASQSILGHARSYVEHIAVKIYGQKQGEDIEADKDTIPKSMEYIKRESKYLFLRRFHGFLQQSASHYLADRDGAERLMMKYYEYFLQIRCFMKKEFQMDVLSNLEKFPVDMDKSVQEYHEKIAQKIRSHRDSRDFSHELEHARRMYVYKVTPFAADGEVFYEVILNPADDAASKFDHFICFSSFLMPTHYSVKAGIIHDAIEIQDKKMPISILTEYMVSIRPCELKNYASIFIGNQLPISSKSAEYRGMMEYLTLSGVSLYEIAASSQAEYDRIKRMMFGRSRVHGFEAVLDMSRELILSANFAGLNVTRYLLHTLGNKVIKNQRGKEKNEKLSGLYLKYGCIPFDNMPFAFSLIQHNPKSEDLFECISPEGREHEMLARKVRASMNEKACLYIPIEELDGYADKLGEDIKRFNKGLYYKHCGKRMETFGDNIYVREAYDDTREIIERLKEAASDELQGYSNAIEAWLKETGKVDSEEKKNILREMFAKSRVTMLYGAAGTGKTYIINHLAQFFNGHPKLFLANTNPAVENLRRKVSAQNCEFMTIRKFLMTKDTDANYEILVIDECSMVSNADMARILRRASFQLLVLAGDTHQIESIEFGNWFAMAKYFLPEYAWNELEYPYRTSDQDLLDFWKKVRNLNGDIAEHIVRCRYASNLDSSVFKEIADDEIVLCLNYDGLYGINNINRFFQENRPGRAYRWGMWTFKVGDPILFNESERFAPLLYNNLKGRIVDIEIDENGECIWFSIEIEKALTELDVIGMDLELVECKPDQKSIVKFRVARKKDEDDEYDMGNDVDVPFQIAYAISIHKAQGLEYDSVKIIITKDVDERITHNIFYTAITRSRKHLKIYWSPETQQKILEGFTAINAKRDAQVFSGQSKIKMVKHKKKKKDL